MELPEFSFPPKQEMSNTVNIATDIINNHCSLSTSYVRDSARRSIWIVSFVPPDNAEDARVISILQMEKLRLNGQVTRQRSCSWGRDTDLETKAMLNYRSTLTP